MSEKPLVIFANRWAGALQRLGGPHPLARLARAAGFEPRVVLTRSPRHLQRLLRDQVVGKLDRVAIAGGDGTVHLAIQVLAETKVALGILPQGTANNFAKALRLPADLPSAFRVIAGGHHRDVDLGQAEGEYFAEAAGVGIFADVLAMTRASHRLTAVLRGLRVVVGTLIFNRPRRLTLVIDGESRADDVMNVTIANSFAVGYNIPIAPTARVTDAQLDVVVVGALGRSEMLAYWRAIQAQTHLELPKVSVFRAREVTITSRHRMAVHVDERANRRTPITARIVPSALRVLVDRL